MTTHALDTSRNIAASRDMARFVVTARDIACIGAALVELAQARQQGTAPLARIEF